MITRSTDSTSFPSPTMPFDSATLYDAEAELYEHPTASTLRRKAGQFRRQKPQFAAALNYYAGRVERAPKHRGKACLTWIICGNCPPWPHG